MACIFMLRTSAISTGFVKMTAGTVTSTVPSGFLSGVASFALRRMFTTLAVNVFGWGNLVSVPIA